MKRKVIALFLVFAAALMLVNSIFAAESATSETWQVLVGKETDSTSLDSMFPKVVYIHEGDTVVFTNGAKGTPHTVTFLAGQAPLTPEDPTFAIPTTPSGVSWEGKTLLNSGILIPTNKYEITFKTSGAYSFYCVLHPMMTGTVVVVPKGQPIPSKAEQAAAVKAQENELLVQVQALEGNSDAAYIENNDGSLTYKVEMGSSHSTLSHNRMMPDLVVVSEGDSVQWTNYSPYEPHWVTFNKPADLNFLTEKGFNPAFMAPSGGNQFNGTGFTNSGIMMSNQSYSLKFTKAGSYAYECFLHSGSLMKGTVVVVPKTAVKLLINGKVVADSAKAEWKNGRLNVSIAAFAKALGGKAAYDNKLKAMIVTVGEGKAVGKVQKTSGVPVFVNGNALQSPGYIVKGTYYASAEEIVRALGGSYAWNDKTKTFTVMTGVNAAAADHAMHH